MSDHRVWATTRGAAIMRWKHAPKKEDPERAEAVLEVLWRSLDGQPPTRENLFQHIPFLVEVFQAVRGEHA